jgi:hypothetical protein
MHSILFDTTHQSGCRVVRAVLLAPNLDDYPLHLFTLHDFNKNNPIGNAVHFPLCKRGIEGDFCTRMKFKSPLTPLLQRGGECSFATQHGSNELFGFKARAQQRSPEPVEGKRALRRMWCSSGAMRLLPPHILGTAQANVLDNLTTK